MNQKTKTIVVVTSLLGLGTLFAGATATAAQADPPHHATANGYRNKQDQDKDDKHHRDNDRRRDQHGYQHDARDKDWAHERYQNRRRNDDNQWNGRIPATIHGHITTMNRDWRNRDSDGDGVPDYRDRYPNDRHRH